MLTQKEIQLFTVPKSSKIHALYDVILYLNEADDVLNDYVYRYMPFSADSEWQDEADNFFWNSEGMHEINDVACAIRKARDLARHAICILKGSPEAKAAS